MLLGSWQCFIVGSEWHRAFLSAAVQGWHCMRRTFQAFGVLVNVNRTATKSRLVCNCGDGRMGEVEYLGFFNFYVQHCHKQ